MPLSRNSEDTKLINKRGKEFLDICRVNNLTIANGRTLGDFFGKFTCHQKKGSSVVDYLITPWKNLDNILEFKVGDINSILSDHCPIMVTLTVKMLNLPDRFIWDTDSTGTFLETLKSEEYKTKVEGLLEKEDLKVEDIKDLLIDTANTSRIRKTKKSHRKKTDKPWFDKTCLTLKNEIYSCGKHLRTHPDDMKTRERIYFTKKKLRNTVRKNKIEFKKSIIDNMCSDLSSKQQKKYWNGLKKLEGRRDEQKYVPDYTMINHFKELLYDDEITLNFGQQKTAGED